MILAPHLLGHIEAYQRHWPFSPEHFGGGIRIVPDIGLGMLVDVPGSADGAPHDDDLFHGLCDFRRLT